MTLERTILEVLRDVSPRMMPEPALLGAARISASEPPTRLEFENALLALQQKPGGAQIVGITGDDARKWKITAAGLARLAD